MALSRAHTSADPAELLNLQLNKRPVKHTQLYHQPSAHQLVIPSHRLTTYGRRAFSVAGPMFRNSLPRHLRDPSHTDAVFGRLLKKHFSSQSTGVHSASEALAMMRYIN